MHSNPTQKAKRDEVVCLRCRCSGTKQQHLEGDDLGVLESPSTSLIVRGTGRK